MALQIAEDTSASKAAKSQLTAYDLGVPPGTVASQSQTILQMYLELRGYGTVWLWYGTPKTWQSRSDSV